MKQHAKEAVLLLSVLVVCAIHAAPMVKAAPDPVTPDSPDPLNTCWLVRAPGDLIDDALLTIYWRTETGTFTAMPAWPGVAGTEGVEDKIANANQNPIISGYFNPDKPAGIALADLHITSVSSYYFYVKIEYPPETGLLDEYWPTETSYKQLEDGGIDPEWGYPEEVVDDAGSPSGYSATGNGLGNGPTTAYPIQPPPPPVIPEVPFGTMVSFLSMLAVLAVFVGVRRFRPKSH